MKTKTLTLLALTLCSYLPADNMELPKEPKNEFQQLAIIATKYGNNPEGIPALHYAIIQQDEPAIDLLLKYGASPFTKDFLNNNSLQCAIKNGNLKFVKKFIDIGLDPEEFRGFDNHRFMGGHFPLQHAILENQNEIAKYLIDYGVKLNPIRYYELESDGLMFFDFLADCARTGNLEIYNILVSHGLEHKDKLHFLSALMDVVGQKYRQQKIEMFKNLLDRGIFGPNDMVYDKPLIHYAANPEYGIELLQILLEKGANPNVLGSEGSQRNVFLNSGGLINESAIFFDTQKEIIQLLVQYGADINHKDRFGNTPLMFASGPQMIAFLKSQGAK